MSEFKGKSVYEKSHEYAKSKCSEEIGNKFIPETDLTVYEACEFDFRNGYNQALEDSKAKEMLEMLKRFLEMHKEYDMRPEDELCDYAYDVEQLIKQATEI